MLMPTVKRFYLQPLRQSWCCILAISCIYHDLVGGAWLVMDLWGTPLGMTQNVAIRLL